ncbi:hypothetical protein G6F70_001454 [Rhizopus microsporus]|nr:hypothetical protein G6F71_004921 [Rhizopus microsporus]KAG1203376.1 hypothetical protein G6F70_001454 [Rhizopus microsporus]KAG1214053.1 hypothetical protein G6F69_002291 [Rhizopus microsporus]KAG1236338.1 hypothetical protein G6F67_002047 [Rhizopus microsporus]KAG1265191.1 hypothetical protein G6F68_003771 [Rhizopus microsporus]
MSVHNLVLNPISFDSPGNLSLMDDNHSHTSRRKNRNRQCMPSDDEEDDEKEMEEEDEDDEDNQKIKQMPLRKSTQLPSDDEEDNQTLDTFVHHSNRSAPTVVLNHLQQRQQQYQYQQARLAQFHHHPSSMTGMDLLTQLEKEKAAKKRATMKPLNSQIKIEGGLLGQLPEQGTHSISFQQLEQEQMKKRFLDPGLQQQQQRRSYYRSHSRSPSPHKK